LTKAIIFNNEIEAKQWDWLHNRLKGSVSKYRFNRVPLNKTTEFTKSQYAELYNIPKKIEDEEGNEVDNPRYTELKSSYTLRNFALDVGNAFDDLDEEGNVVGYKCKNCGANVSVEEISDDEIYSPEVEI